MEITKPGPKKLEKHTVPIVIAAVGFMLFSLASFNYYSSPGATTSLRGALMGHFLSVKAQSNGLAKVSVVHTSEPTSKPPTITTLGVRGTSTGETAQLSIDTT
jgi:hypothetical protein